MPILIRKVFAHLHTHGLKLTIHRAWQVLRKLWRRLWLREHYFIYIKQLFNTSNRYRPLIGLVFRKALEEDIPKVITQFASHYGNDGEKVLSHRLASGERLLLGFTESDCQTICFLSWLSETDPSFLAAADAARLNEGVCCCGALVPLQFRRMGVGRAGIAYAEQQALDEGYKEVWGFVLTHNDASKKMFERQAWGIKGSLIRGSFLGHKYYRVAL